MANNSKSLPGNDYFHLRQALEQELVSATERLRRTYQAELVRTYWNIGRVLREQAGLLDKPSAANAQLIARLSKDLGRRDTFFYDAAKFHRLYPKAPPDALSWSHYSLLIRLDDPQKRRALENKAVREGINAKDFRMYTRLPPALDVPGKTISKESRLPLERGRLYHYQVASDPKDGHLRVDVGFGIEREVSCSDETSLHAGLIVRAVKEGEDYSLRIAPYEKLRLFTYRAILDRVIDGDTLVVHIDVGFRTWVSQKLRLRDIDTPEVTCAAGLKASAEVKARLTPCPCLVVRTYKQEKYGRFLADVFYKSGTDDAELILNEGVFLNQELLDLGLAVPYDGGAKEGA